MDSDSLGGTSLGARIGPFYVTHGIHNLRDYGGYAVPGGGRVRTGVLLRSGQHMEASDEDLDLIHALDIRTVIDLRGTSEREGFPCRRHASFAAQVIAHDGETTNSPPHEGGGGRVVMTPAKARERMLAVYTRMPVNPAMIDIFSRYFKALDENDGASLVHCFAGKDRTGIAASLLLHVLGVHHDDIVAEFLLTNEAPTRAILERQSLPRMQAHYGAIEPEALHNLMGVLPEYIDTYIAKVTEDHGSLDGYLATILGVDDARKERLRAKLVA
ncbi:tyrosine-protein phosphatase [Porphyrobacter sp. CACIAM 03H1]|jgi:protein-tyrosine phosphatase|uniref:tyrosine-protein phosphatase n=1 Tax=Porphyrobacter sp. CACIAM 03H1 TaxID=2003315 RepID=UPI000B5A93DA|nr:tyrosine-protein phosphatase [Porphyrobacter sp. CACIAM 03H1]ASJ91733.1 protein tyrosine phosphatase [Porphyrobacter sp. CACIAM 03H1]